MAVDNISLLILSNVIAILKEIELLTFWNQQKEVYKRGVQPHKHLFYIVSNDNDGRMVLKLFLLIILL